MCSGGGVSQPGGGGMWSGGASGPIDMGIWGPKGRVTGSPGGLFSIGQQPYQPYQGGFPKQPNEPWRPPQQLSGWQQANLRPGGGMTRTVYPEGMQNFWENGQIVESGIRPGPGARPPGNMNIPRGYGQPQQAYRQSMQSGQTGRGRDQYLMNALMGLFGGGGYMGGGY